MKLSLAWLFDHIDADWRTIDVQKMVNLFNQKTAEIEGFQTFKIDLQKFAAAKVISSNQNLVAVEVPEWKHTIDMFVRTDIQIGQMYLIVKERDSYSWAKQSDLASEKEGLLPAVHIDQQDINGGWKKTIETEDVILFLDNKSINHRPDMWGHRGVAREVAALLNLPFKALDHMLVQHTIKEYPKQSAAKEHSFSIALDDNSCKRFAGLYFDRIESIASIPWMAARLARVDSKSINAIVDTTNYVMLDLGQPMHAFDVATLDTKSIVVRNAKNKETITLLDGTTVELASQDCVVTDGKKPIALAGIMGAKDTGVSQQTESIFIEAACFDATALRKTAGRLKKRTESSARFEKSLDPHQITIAIERFLKLLDDMKIKFKAQEPIIVVGSKNDQKEINISHAYIEQLLGITIDSQFVIKTLERLEFSVDHKNGVYHITVPSFRATKDIAIKQDIVEEIGRFYGYDAITPHLPSRQTKPFDLTAVMRTRRIKQLLAYGLEMKELYTYAFFDESFLQTINWQPEKALRVQEAVSQNWQRLVTSLIPNLLKAVHIHAPDLDSMNFFEMACIWPQENNDVQEKLSLSGIFVDQKKQIDFYDGKLKLCKLAQLLKIKFDWIAADQKELAPWYLPYQTSYLMCDGNKIGVAGKVNPSFFTKVAAGDAFIFELDANFLLSHQLPLQRFAPASKYPGMVRDVSVLIPLAATVSKLRNDLQKLDAKISHVALVDFFQKPEWHNQKSLTFSITMIDPEKTMASENADAIINKVISYLQKQGATIR